MPEKGDSQSWIFHRSNFVLQWRLHVLAAFVFLGMVIIGSIDGGTIRSIVESRRSTKQYLTKKTHTQHPFTNLTQQQEILRNFSAITKNGTTSTPLAQESNDKKPLTQNPLMNLTRQQETLQNFSTVTKNGTTDTYTRVPPSSNMVLNNNENVSFAQNYSDGVLENLVSGRNGSDGSVKWLSTELEPNLTENLLSRWLAPGGEPCRESRTVEIVIPGLDGKDLIELTAGDSHEFRFQALDESKNLVCSGGDYFETDLSGEAWKSRPLVRDFGNGSYSILLQVHPDFAGDYNLTLILLYRHFLGLKFSPWRFVFDKQLRKFRIKFVKGGTRLPKIGTCEKSDFNRDLWLGSGSLGMLESNGWVYSSHCSFRLFSADSAWNCLKNRWVFFWGDSNHVDTIRNTLNFVLDLPQISSVPRRFDLNFSNPKDASQTVRITSIFNGHWNETMNYEGFNSLMDEGFRSLLKKYFSEDTVPDTIIMNSGLHDGVHWRNLRAYSEGAGFAASFWKEVMDSVRQRGLAVPRIFYRTTIATGGYAKSLAFNPNKMEAFNWVALDKFRRAGLVSGVIDNFDMTFPWHFDNRCNDGVHYGRPLAKMKWRDGEIGHQYFVDFMLAHVLLNALCSR
ncbi:CYTOCHROME P450 FAMILY PROTEIN [Salix purpurea]|uniref:CYTOCHROME P450 FAMILY PROTEIN n=1 Tax=Salix purpurea TaxID=77065 RepID=A0A9Q0Z8H3_SALPP|nr:CYTOCHROME P450 FAMILY PROTEIN [Salix purpurea]